MEGTRNPPEIIPHLSKLDMQRDPDSRAKVTNILNKYVDVFRDRVGHTKLIEHESFLKNPTPIVLKPYLQPKEKQSIIDTNVRDIEKQSLVEPSTSPWVEPKVLAKKDGVFVDYRRLNDVTESDAYRMPDLNKLIRQMRGAKIFSVLNFKSGYWQVLLN